MLTLPSVESAAVERPSYRPFRATVSHVRRLSPHFTRVTFTGRDFGDFGAVGLDQRLKLVLPLPGIGVSDFGVDDPVTHADGSWYTRWRALPDDVRNPIRTYTVRAVRPERREIDVDFVAHAHGTGPAVEESRDASGGPAADWLRAAVPGAELVIVGPDARGSDPTAGLDWRPGAATRLLLVGDETAVPAISSILESLPAGREARVFLEVPTGGDALPIRVPEGCEVTWLDRGTEPRGHRLTAAVRDWATRERFFPDRAASAVGAEAGTIGPDSDSEPLWGTPVTAPAGEFYAWLAGESGVIKLLRRFLVREIGIDRTSVAFMGYWRLGASEAS